MKWGDSSWFRVKRDPSFYTYEAGLVLVSKIDTGEQDTHMAYSLVEETDFAKESPPNSRSKHTGGKKTTTKNHIGESSHHGSAKTNLTSILRDTGLIPGLAQGVKP